MTICELVAAAVLCCVQTKLPRNQKHAVFHHHRSGLPRGRCRSERALRYLSRGRSAKYSESPRVADRHASTREKCANEKRSPATEEETSPWCFRFESSEGRSRRRGRRRRTGLQETPLVRLSCLGFLLKHHVP